MKGFIIIVSAKFQLMCLMEFYSTRSVIYALENK